MQDLASHHGSGNGQNLGGRAWLVGWENLQSRAVVNPGGRMGGIGPLLTAMLLLGENDAHCCIRLGYTIVRAMEILLLPAVRRGTAVPIRV